MRDTLRLNRINLLKKKGVVACGIGYKVVNGKRTKDKAIVCSVKRKVPMKSLSMEHRVPPDILGFPTDVVKAGVIKAFAADPTGKFRPAPGGVSIGHPDITAGTLGVVLNLEDGRFILSNNHVLANSNLAQIGDPIIQPGTYDGGTRDDQIATLEKFVEVKFATDLLSDCNIAGSIVKWLNRISEFLGSMTRIPQPVLIQPEIPMNKVDCALARPLSDDFVADEILEIGKPDGDSIATLGMPLKKFGRTTLFTEGTVDQVDVTVNVQYGEGKIAMFEDQLLAGPMSAGGDSGSAVLNDDNELVGLLFAGSEDVTIINRIENVYQELGI